MLVRLLYNLGQFGSVETVSFEGKSFYEDENILGILKNSSFPLSSVRSRRGFFSDPFGVNVDLLEVKFTKVQGLPLTLGSPGGVIAKLVYTEPPAICQ